MERNFCLNWQVTVEEAKYRRKSQRLTQAHLAELAGVSTPTVSRFENGEKDIYLSTVLSILAVLGMQDKRTLVFKDPNIRYDFNREVVLFSGYDGETLILCGISKEALDDHFNTEDEVKEKVEQNFERISHEAKRKYILQGIGAEGIVLVQSTDLS